MLNLTKCAIPLLVLSSLTTAQDRTVALTSTTQFLAHNCAEDYKTITNELRAASIRGRVRL